MSITSQLSPIDSKQQTLTQQYLIPHLEALESELNRIRGLLDPELQQQFPLNGGKPYPIGRCMEISSAVYQQLQAYIQQPEYLIHRVLQQFVIEGGIAKRVWGALRDQYFQNAFQFGSLYVDVSNDTVDPSKPRVEILPLENSGFCNITDFRHFARVARRYWQCEIWTNTVLPDLSPVFPLVVFYRQQGEVSLQPKGAYMQMLNQQSGFELAENFLRDPGEETGPMPAPVTELLVEQANRLGYTVAAGSEAALARCETYRANQYHREQGFLLEMLEKRNRFLGEV